ncbi:MAG: Lrp/AsnC family transcriptional regulator [Candidatus Bathyarchaeia archaeon]|nr:Lrp/AsnC family transcriptional regulator [Candidatus Bathyarchaeota archaeon]
MIFMEPEIDEVDREIIRMLQDDARISFRKIAEKLNVSEATIFIRVKKLLERNIIKRFTAIVSPEVLGKKITAFILLKADPKKLNNVLETISRIDDVYEVYDVTGSYYAIVKIRTEDQGKLRKIIDEIGLIDGVLSTETAIVLRSVKEETRIKV